MPVLNYFPCYMNKELTLWKNSNISKREYDELREEYENIRFPDAQRKIAFPKREGFGKTLPSLGFDLTEVSVNNHLKSFSELCKYGFVSFLQDYGFKALHEEHDMVRRNQISKLYKTDSSILDMPENNPQLKIFEGLEFRRRYWDFPSSGTNAGLSIKHTVTPYFTEPVDIILDNLNEFNPYVQMKCPANCDKKDCHFYSEKRLIGKFKGFNDEGYACRFSEEDYDTFVRLSDTRENIEKNPPANRVSIERNYSVMSEWAERKYGIENLRSRIAEARGTLRNGRKNPKKIKEDYESVMDLIDPLPDHFVIPNAQTVFWNKEMVEIEVQR